MRSAPQKQPMPKSASAAPSGNGGTMRLPLTKWASGTLNGVSRPGSASPASGSSSFFGDVNHIGFPFSDPRSVV
jgi:hypothetical protein